MKFKVMLIVGILTITFFIPFNNVMATNTLLNQSIVPLDCYLEAIASGTNTYLYISPEDCIKPGIIPPNTYLPGQGKINNGVGAVIKPPMLAVINTSVDDEITSERPDPLAFKPDLGNVSQKVASVSTIGTLSTIVLGYFVKIIAVVVPAYLVWWFIIIKKRRKNEKQS